MTQKINERQQGALDLLRALPGTRTFEVFPEAKNVLAWRTVQNADNPAVADYELYRITPDGIPHRV